MTVAVSGPGSMLGKRLLGRLGAYCQLVSIGRSPESDIVLDLREIGPASSCGQTADVMIHCAATFGGIGDSIENEIANAVGCLRMGQLAAAMKCRHLIYICTLSALPQNLPGNSYGLSKRHGQENLELICGDLGIRLTSLLVTHIYDDLGQGRKHQPAFYRIIDCAREGRVFQFFGREDPLRNFLFLDDFVTVIERAMASGVTGAYPVTHPVSQHVSEIVTLAFDVYGRAAVIERLPDKPSFPSVFYPEDTALYDLIGYSPETTLRDGIAMIRDRMP